MKQKMCIAIIMIISVLLVTPVAWADLVSYPGFKKILSQSSLICAGQVINVRLSRSPQQESKTILVATFAIDHVVTGALSSGELEVQLAETPADRLPADVSSQIRGKRWLLFLQASSDSSPFYTLVGGLHGMILVSPQVPPTIPKVDDSEAHIEVELLAALTSSNPQVISLSLALIEEWGRKSTNVFTALQSLSVQANEANRGQAIATRLSLGDLTALPLTLSYRGPENAMNQIKASISAVSDPGAIPELTRLMKSDNVYVKRGAIYALRMLASKEESFRLSPVFRAALEDADRDVQYNAGMGLGKLAEATPGGMVLPLSRRQGDGSLSLPARDEFDKDPDTYVGKWKNQSGNKGSGDAGVRP